MKNIITILVSLGTVLCYQTAFSQTAAKTTKTGQAQAAEIQAQIAEALYAKQHAGKHVISWNRKNPGDISLNGKRYKRAGNTQYMPYYTHDKNDKRVYINEKYAQVETYVNGKDTIQVEAYPKREKNEGVDRTNAELLYPAPDSKTTSIVRYGTGDSKYYMEASKSEDGNSYFVEKAVFNRKTGEQYKLRVKRNTTHPQSRTDIQGGTFQSVNHTDIRKTFEPSLGGNYDIYGPETSYK